MRSLRKPIPVEPRADKNRPFDVAMDGVKRKQVKYGRALGRAKRDGNATDTSDIFGLRVQAMIRQAKAEAERMAQHGPVKVLVKDGKRVEE